MTSAGTATRGGAFDRLLVAALFLLAVVVYPYAALIIDSGRDLAWGLSIARGDAFPLYGPSLNGLWQLGPAWYYLLAVPLLATGSVGATAGLIGLLAACKIPLAYRVGASQGGSGLGLTFAAMISLPGWSTLGQMVLSHTSLTEVTVLGTLALSLRAVQRHSAKAAVGAALMLSLAMHAHPTALVAAPALAVALWQTARHRGERRWLLMAAAAFVAPFVPALIAEAAAGWPQWRNSTGYFGSADYLTRLSRLPRVLHGLTIGQWQFAQDFLLSRSPFSGRLLGIAWAATLAAAIFGLVWRGWRQRIGLSVAGLMLWSWLLVILLRDQTPAWMVYAWSPISCALLALGWHGLWPAARILAASRALALVSVLLGSSILFDRLVVARDGVQFLPGEAVADIASPVHRDLPVRFWLPAWAHDSTLIAFCGDTPGLAVHGELAAALGFAQGVAYSLHCPAGFELSISGVGQHSLAGIPAAVARELGLRGRTVAGGYTVLEPARVLAPLRGERIELHRRYRADDFSSQSAREPFSLELVDVCGSGEILVVANLLPGLNTPFQVSTSAQGGAPPLIGETLTSRYYRCPESGAFALTIHALDATATDVFVLRAGSD